MTEKPQPLRKSSVTVMTPMTEASQPHLLGINVSKWPKWLILCCSSVGIFACFLLHGLAHEKLMKEFHFTETVFLTFWQFTGYAVLALPTIIRLFSGKMKLAASMKTYVITSAALQISMCLANFAALRLSYATEVLFKSAKLIPVMIGNIIFLKKKPTLAEVISVCLLVCGLVGISLGDFRGKNKFDFYGVVAVCGALCFDAVSSNMEDKVMSVYGGSQTELIALVYGIGAICIGILATINGQMASGISRCIDNPLAILYIAFFALLGALGIQFVYLTMKVFGSLLTVMVTSLRKAMTVILSFLVFKDKRFTIWHGYAICLLVAGIGLNIYNKNSKKKNVAPVGQDEINDESSLLAYKGVELSGDLESDKY